MPTENHDFRQPPRGQENWDQDWYHNFDTLDERVVARGVEADRSEYTPYENSLYLATDTENIFRGTGDGWEQLESFGVNPEFGQASADKVTINNEPVDPTDAVRMQELDASTGVGGEFSTTGDGTSTTFSWDTGITDPADIQYISIDPSSRSASTDYTRFVDGTSIGVEYDVAPDDGVTLSWFWTVNASVVSVEAHDHTGDTLNPDSVNSGSASVSNAPSADTDVARQEEINTLDSAKAEQSEVDSLSTTVDSKADQDGGGTASLDNYGSVNTDGLSVGGWDEYDITELGADDTGTEAIDSIVTTNVDNGVKFVFPEGTYLVNTITLTNTDTNKVAFEARGDVTIVRPDTSGSGAAFVSDPADPVETLIIEGFDHQCGGTYRFASLIVGEYGRVAHCRHFGEMGDAPGPLRADATTSDAFIEVDHFRAQDGGIAGTATESTGVYIGESHAGRARVTDVFVEGFPDNGVYASNGTGPVIVDGGYIANNGQTNLRLGTTGAVGKSVTIANEEGVGHDGRAVWAEEGTGITFRDLNVELTSGTAPTAAFEVDSAAGAVEFADCHAIIDGHGGRLLNVGSYSGTGADSHVSFRNVTVTGASSHTTDRLCSIARPMTIQNCEWDITTTTDTTQTMNVQAGFRMVGCDITSDIVVVRGFSAASQCLFQSNSLESTDGASEINLSGSENVATGNIVSNGISITGESVGNVVRA